MRRNRSPYIYLSRMAAAAVLAHAGAALAAAPTLKQAVEAAWARQPEARAMSSRQEEMAARRHAAAALFPAPPSIGLAQRTDRFNSRRGDRETEAELAFPLWMPGTRDAAQRLAAAETEQLETGTLAIRLRIAGEVREAYWQARLAQNEQAVAARKAGEAAELLADVERRFKAGDLARTEWNQAQGLERLARAAAAEAAARAQRAQRQFQALTGLAALPEAEEPQEAALHAPAPHPLLSAAGQAVKVGRARLGQASAERREPPELALGFVRERSAAGEAYDNSVRIAVRIPLATAARNAPRVSAASAELLEAEASLAMERERIDAEIDAARSELEQARAVASLSGERHRLAVETQELHAKAFKLGELELAARLRSENERFDAELALSRAGLELGRAISRLNQALGLLP